jgi:hypothetical protein
MTDHRGRVSGRVTGPFVARLITVILITAGILGLVVLAARRAPLHPHPLPSAFLGEAWLLAMAAVALVLVMGVTVLALAPRSAARSRGRNRK